jgi:hypothetical protein
VGEIEDRSDLDRRAEIRSALIKPKLLDLGRTRGIQRPGSDLSAVAPLSPTARARRRQGGQPWRGSSGLGKWSGTFRATRRTRPWAQNRHGGASERRPQWEKSRGGATNSGEQLRGLWGDTWRNKGMGRVLTLSANSGTLGERRGCDGASGRRRRGSGCARNAPVSVDRAN